MVVLFGSIVFNMGGVLTVMDLRAFGFEIYYINQVRTIEGPKALLDYSLLRCLAPGQIPYSFIP